MAIHEMFDSSVRSAGDVAGVFEYDGETGYFYLYEMDGDQGQKILDSIHILSGEPDFVEADIWIGWDSEERKVGLFIGDVLWAVFDGCAKYGGSYKPGARPSLPPEAEKGFEPLS
jgi:hypothetical protein